MVDADEGSDRGPTGPEDMTLTNLTRFLSDRSEATRPFVPWLGGPRLYLLLLYASVVIGVSAEFFLSQEIWYGGWEVYNTYVFAVTGVFVLVGLVMLFSVMPMAGTDGDRRVFGLKKDMMSVLGFLVLAVSGMGLAAAGSSVGGLAVLLSVLVVVGFVMMILGSRGFDEKDAIWLALFGTGVVLMLLVPVHEAYDVARSAPGDYPFTGLNLLLLATGMGSCLVALQFMRTRDGYFAAWLLGAMSIFLVAFHEQVGILPSDSYEAYDRTLALIGVLFSFLPLSVYLWREKEFFTIWSNLRTADSAMRKGNFVSALKHAEVALAYSNQAALSGRFAMPWSMKGDALYAMKEYTKARSHYDIALEIDPEDSISWCHLGNIYAFEGKRALALSAYDRALKIDNNDAHAWNNKGVIFGSLSWPEEAVACFQRAVALSPDHFDSRINLARMSAKMGRSDEAVINFQHALELRPDSEAAQKGLHREFRKGMLLDQIRGWEQLGMDTTHLRSMLSQDPANFEKRTKEFLSSIVEQRTQLTIGSGKELFNVNDAIKAILKVTENRGATMDKIEKETHLSRDQLVLPMALLMKTDHLHFKRAGSKEVYVNKGKMPEEPEPRKPQREKKVRAKSKRMEPTASVLVFGRKK
jgi:tetratricopeptide (TPR) repeat protein